MTQEHADTFPVSNERVIAKKHLEMLIPSRARNHSKVAVTQDFAGVAVFRTAHLRVITGQRSRGDCCARSPTTIAEHFGFQLNNRHVHAPHMTVRGPPNESCDSDRKFGEDGVSTFASRMTQGMEAVLCITKAGVVRCNRWTRQPLSDAWDATNWERLCGIPWQMVAVKSRQTKKERAMCPWPFWLRSNIGSSERCGSPAHLFHSYLLVSGLFPHVCDPADGATRLSLLVTPSPLGSSNVGSRNGSVPDLDGMGARSSSTVEEKNSMNSR